MYKYYIGSYFNDPLSAFCSVFHILTIMG